MSNLDDKTLDLWQTAAEKSIQSWDGIVLPPEEKILRYPKRVIALISALRENRQEIAHLREALENYSDCYSCGLKFGPHGFDEFDRITLMRQEFGKMARDALSSGGDEK